MSSCPYDYVKITDGDGTALLEESCGYSSHDPSSSSYFLPPVITTKTNTMHVFFHSDGSGTQTGWSLNWIAVTPGLNYFQTVAFAYAFFPSILFFFQNAVLQIQRAHAQTLKLLTASTSLPLPESTAAAASAWILLGSVLLVDLARPLELDSGKSCHFVL